MAGTATEVNHVFRVVHPEGTEQVESRAGARTREESILIRVPRHQSSVPVTWTA